MFRQVIRLSFVRFFDRAFTRHVELQALKYLTSGSKNI